MYVQICKYISIYKLVCTMECSRMFANFWYCKLEFFFQKNYLPYYLCKIVCESKFIFSHFYIINFVINNKQDWKGFQSPMLWRIAIVYNVFLKSDMVTSYNDPLARIWRESDENLARIWRESGKNLARISNA